MPRTQAPSGRSAAVSKCTTCASACTPASVRPAQIVATGSPGDLGRARARARPARRSPAAASASRRSGCRRIRGRARCACIKNKNRDSSRCRGSIPVAVPASREFEQLLRLRLLLGVAFLDDFLQDFPGAVLVAHFLVRLGEIELGLDVVPMPVLLAAAARGLGRLCLVAQIEVGNIELEIEPGVRVGASRRSPAHASSGAIDLRQLDLEIDHVAVLRRHRGVERDVGLGDDRVGSCRAGMSSVKSGMSEACARPASALRRPCAQLAGVEHRGRVVRDRRRRTRVERDIGGDTRRIAADLEVHDRSPCRPPPGPPAPRACRPRRADCSDRARSPSPRPRASCRPRRRSAC